MDLTHSSFLVVPHCLLNFRTGIHNKRALLYHRLIQRDTSQQQDLGCGTGR